MNITLNDNGTFTLLVNNETFTITFDEVTKLFYACDSVLMEYDYMHGVAQTELLED
jgi:hypothetical protein